ncbi:MAG: tRNA uracil 4-sulfurtransferase ThiI [Candidatus Nanoarchaeia archaeon]|nr:tRNA 4-thiouridine(8) synthase ThiI [Candidatus Haiyanarchaeum thermophilum]MCW1306725.1 tRNA 4-thiouridine(8) synthase ThiI [Candidatus Haiyanarchaeum thermophilum]MCW1307564.1 tRNA 4-thiouridine(8) synthase ThiI [Candidatus Haiyanarchaeum thermophilum]MCW1308546.1 tRNA 4-thiouridine(8) synthase ThiI [Candidatus Haiyanarchaeum thermophilum]
MDGILVAYSGEIFIKSERTRRNFERKLVDNIKHNLKARAIEFQLKKMRGRIFIRTNQIKEACKALEPVFGIAWMAPCYHLSTSNLNEIVEFCRKNYKHWLNVGEKFAVDARREGKHPYTSQQLAREIGNVIRRKVDLSNPDKKIYIEVRGDETFIYLQKFNALRGLPVGTAGKVISLISGGIDSPVSSIRMMKRGCEVVLLHFHSFPLVSRASIEKVKELAQIMRKFQKRIVLYLIPFGEIQMKIKAKVDAQYRIVIYRRLMLKIAERIAQLEGAKAIVTGESLAQVSSQTLQNIYVIEEATSFPIFRPLIGMDKEEIVREAKRFGTYEISIRPQEDCCQLFVPRHPTTQAQLKKVLEFEKKIKVEELVEEALSMAEKIVIG